MHNVAGEPVSQPFWENDQPNRRDSRCARAERLVLGGKLQYPWGNWKCNVNNAFTCRKGNFLKTCEKTVRKLTVESYSNIKHCMCIISKAK